MHQAPIRDLDALLEPFARPAAHIAPSRIETTSWFGGQPPAVEGFAWPTHLGRPLPFLACIDLDAIHDIRWLPESGRLLFFYDLEAGAWGTGHDDPGAWRVVYVSEAPTAPGGANTPPPQNDVQHLPRQSIAFDHARTLPSWNRTEVADLALTGPETDRLHELRWSQAFGGAALHRIGGYPDGIQHSDMETTCELDLRARRGIPFSMDDREAIRREAAGTWRLLLQFDTDDSLGVSWGDTGTLYFWARKDEAARGDFSNTWIQMQCY